MTPFEYDENPWDGWGVWSDNSIGENSNAGFVTVKLDANKPPASFLPLDGDPATDENKAMVIDWTQSLPPAGGPKVIKQLRHKFRTRRPQSNSTISGRPIRQL